MQSAAWVVCALALIARSSALPAEAGQPLRCFSCGGEGGACGSGSPGHALCPPDRPLCATRASSPDFKSVLSCSAAIESVCSLVHDKRNYEMTCVCSTDLCNAPFSHQMLIELINFANYNSANNGTQLYEVFWKLSHLANGSDPKVYNKITEEMEAVSEGTVWIGSEATTSIKALGASTMTPGEKSQQLAVQAKEPHEQSLRLRAEPVWQAETTRAQAVRRGDELQAHAFRKAEEPRAQAVRQPTAAPDDDEDEGEGSGGAGGAYEEAPARHPSPSAPANPSSFLPAGENCAPTVFVNVLTITTVLLYKIM